MEMHDIGEFFRMYGLGAWPLLLLIGIAGAASADEGERAERGWKFAGVGALLFVFAGVMSGLPITG